MKTNNALRIIFIFMITIAYCSCNTAPEYVLKKSYTSPNQEYILELYMEKNYAPQVSMSSESGYRKAIVKLKDKNDKTIVAPGLLSQCEFILTDFKIDWQLESNKIYFTKFNFIDLENKTFDCN